MKGVQDETDERGKMLFMGKVSDLKPILNYLPFTVSGSDELRDHPRDLIHDLPGF